MNIWILTHAIAPEKIGGSETQTRALATELGKRHSVTVVVRKTSFPSEFEKRDNFLIKGLGRKARGRFPLFSFTSSVLREIHNNRKEITVILAKSIQNGTLGVLAGKLFRIPVAVLIESEREFKDRSFWNDLILVFLSRNTRLLVQTPGLQEELSRRIGEKAAVIPNGVYLDEGRARGEKVVYVGRLIRDKINDKGVRYLIEAVKDTVVETLIIGDGPEKENLVALAGTSRNIIFLGKVEPEEVPRFLKQSFVLVLPSIYGEGLPNVILEALAVGLPVIATRTAGIEDIIEHGKTGFLVLPGDSRAIRRYIDLLHRDKALQARMSEDCKKEAARYAWPRVARLFEKILRETSGVSESLEEAGDARRD